jgi:hypothetical protein
LILAWALRHLARAIGPLLELFRMLFAAAMAGVLVIGALGLLLFSLTMR